MTMATSEPVQTTGESNEQVKKRAKELIRTHAHKWTEVEKREVAGLAKQQLVTSGITDGGPDQQAKQAATLQRANAVRRAILGPVTQEMALVESALTTVAGYNDKFTSLLAVGKAIKGSWDEIASRNFMKASVFSKLAKAMRDKKIDETISELDGMLTKGEEWQAKLEAAKARLTNDASPANPALPASLAKSPAKEAVELCAQWFDTAAVEFIRAVDAWQTFDTVAAIVDFEVQATAIKAVALQEGGDLKDIAIIKDAADAAIGWIQPFVKNNRLTGVIFRAYANIAKGAEMAATEAKLNSKVKHYREDHTLSEVMKQIDKDPLAMAKYVIESRTNLLEMAILTIQNALSAGLAATPPGVYELCMPLTDVASTVVNSVFSSYWGEQLRRAKLAYEIANGEIKGITERTGKLDEILKSFGVEEFLNQLKTRLDAALTRVGLDPAKAKKVMAEIAAKTVAPKAAADTVSTYISTDDDTGDLVSNLDTSGLAKEGGTLSFGGAIAGVVNWLLDKIMDKITPVVMKLFKLERGTVQTETSDTLIGYINRVTFDLHDVGPFIDGADNHMWDRAVKNFQPTPFGENDLPDDLADPYELGGKKFPWHRTDRARTRNADDPHEVKYYTSIYYLSDKGQAENKEVWGYYSPAGPQWVPDRLDPKTLPDPNGDHGWLKWDVNPHSIAKVRSDDELAGKWYHVTCEGSSESYCLFVTPAGTHRWASGLEHPAHTPEKVSHSIFNLVTGHATSVTMTKALEMLVSTG